MKDAILTFNVGSSSLKFCIFDRTEGETLDVAARGVVEGIGTHPHLKANVTHQGAHEVLDSDIDDASSHELAIHRVLRFLELHLGDRRIRTVGHRVVHGGARFFEPEIIDDRLITALRSFEPFAPLHQPHNIEGIVAARKLFPDATHVACFDTAFHRHHGWVATAFALPREYYEAGVRRYGFHGLSYEYVLGEVARLEPGLAQARLIIAHLGSGASMCAVKNGRSVDTSMGFSALDGLPMSTRSGALDPGVVLYLMSERKMDVDEITDLLYRKSGLKGLSGLSPDVRDLEASKSPSAKDALDYFVYRARREIGSLAAAISGVDAIIFTAGIGEHAHTIRSEICSGLDWLGVKLDETNNAANALKISSAASLIPVLVIQTDEEVMIARHASGSAANAIP